MESFLPILKYYGIPGVCLAGVIIAWFKMKDKVEKTDCSRSRKEFYEENKKNAVLFEGIQKDLKYIVKQLDSMNGVKR